jgi:hypothetical protein
MSTGPLQDRALKGPFRPSLPFTSPRSVQRSVQRAVRAAQRRVGAPSRQRCGLQNRGARHPDLACGRTPPSADGGRCRDGLAPGEQAAGRWPGCRHVGRDSEVGENLKPGRSRRPLERTGGARIVRPDSRSGARAPEDAAAHLLHCRQAARPVRTRIANRPARGSTDGSLSSRARRYGSRRSDRAGSCYARSAAQRHRAC